MGRRFCFVLLLVVVFSFFLLFNTNTALIWDEVVYKELGEHVFEGYKSDLGENYRAPLFPFFLSFIKLIFPSLTSLHLALAFLWLVGILLVYHTGKKMFGEQAGLAAAAILGSNSYYFFWAHRILSEPLAIIFIILSLFIFYKWQRTRKYRFLYFAYLIAGFAFLARYLAGVLVLVFLLINAIEFFRKEVNIKGLFLSLLIFLLLISPIFILGEINFGSPFGMFSENIRNASNVNADYLFYLDNLLLIVCPIALAFFIFGLSKSDKAYWKIHAFAWFAVIYALVISIYIQKDIRFFIPALPLIALIAGRGYAMLLNIYPSSRNWLNIALAFCIMLPLLAGLLWAYSERNNALEIAYSAGFVKGLDGEVASEFVPHYGYYSNKSVVEHTNITADYLLWTKDKEGIYKKYINKDKIYELMGSIRGVAIYEAD
ncbi:glycosyltransferase family 39 protein [archaeon]|nr:glycosyltransferase family 39 protein [archaeon]